MHPRSPRFDGGGPLAVFGSRSLTGPDVADLIRHALVRSGAPGIVTAAEPAGVCAQARALTAEEGIPLTLCRLPSGVTHAGAFRIRAASILAAAGAVLLIHDGESPGTAAELRLTARSGKPYTYHILAAGRLRTTTGGQLTLWGVPPDAPE